MKKFLQKTLSAVLAVLLLLSCGPFAGLGENLTIQVSAVTANQVVEYALSRAGTEFHQKGMCLAFVNSCFTDLGCASSTACCAYAYGCNNVVSSSKDNIPLGAVVIFSGGTAYCTDHRWLGYDHYCGHAAVYVGNGQVVGTWGGYYLANGESRGYIKKMALSEIINAGYPYVGWRWHGNDVFGSAPTWATFSSDKTTYYAGETATITFNSDSATSYSMTIKKDGVGKTLTGLGKTYSFAVSEGNYELWMSAYNSAGGYDCPTPIKFTVFGTPKWSTFSSDKTEYSLGEVVKITFDSDTATWYNLTLYKNGVLHDILRNLTSPTTLTNLPEGSYLAYMSPYNNAGHSDCSHTISFTVGKYAVTYDANSGTGAPSSQTKVYGTALTLSGTKPTRSGYTFKNWNTKADGSGTTYASGASYTGDANLTLYAQWTAVTTLKSITVKTNPTKTSYYVGDTLNTAGLSLTASYSNGTTQTVTSGFTCSPTILSTVGTQTITVTYNGKTTSFNVTVSPIFVSDITLNSASASVTLGDTKQLSAMVTPSNATNKTVTWTSSNTSVATVSSTGLVTAKAVGKATVTCKAADGHGAYAPCAVTVLPKTPTGVKAVSASYNSVKITWTAVSGATGYAVYRAASKTGTYSYLKSTTATSFTDTSRATGTTYYYKVRAYKTVGETKYYSGYSAIVSAKAVPAVPASFTAAKASGTSVKTSWKAVTGATGYEVWMATSSGGTYSKLTTTTKTTYTKTKLTKNKTYYFKVRAYKTVNDKKVYGAFTAIKSAKPS